MPYLRRVCARRSESKGENEAAIVATAPRDTRVTSGIKPPEMIAIFAINSAIAQRYILYVPCEVLRASVR